MSEISPPQFCPNKINIEVLVHLATALGFEVEQYQKAVQRTPCNTVVTATAGGNNQAAAELNAKALAQQYQCQDPNCRNRAEWVSNITDNRPNTPAWRVTVSVQCT